MAAPAAGHWIWSRVPTAWKADGNPAGKLGGGHGIEADASGHLCYISCIQRQLRMCNDGQ